MMSKGAALCCRYATALAVPACLAAFLGSPPMAGAQSASAAAAASGASAVKCPQSPKWPEKLKTYLKPGTPFPTDNTPVSATDCDFEQWSWEAFVWAMAPGKDGKPRFMALPTPDDLKNTEAEAAGVHPRPLKLAARSQFIIDKGGGEGAGAIVQADGNMMVGPGGHPIYASVHMNPSYFVTVRQNMLQPAGKGQYKFAPGAPYFSVGAAVFKAMWMRVDGAPPAGAFTTKAHVPNLKQAPASNGTISPDGSYHTITVALVGLHVVGYTDNHKEFVWGTFEHNLNTPATPDFTFTTSGVCAKNPAGVAYTFCSPGTSYAVVNQCAYPGPADPSKTFCNNGGLTLDAKKQTVKPLTYAVQENATGGNTAPNGPADIVQVNAVGQKIFAAYHLVGTVWMAPNSLNENSTSANAVGSVMLTNTTAETFRQAAQIGPSPQNNCFACHYPGSNNFNPCPDINALANNFISISHVITEGTPYGTANQIPPPVCKTGTSLAKAGMASSKP